MKDTSRFPHAALMRAIERLADEIYDWQTTYERLGNEAVPGHRRYQLRTRAAKLDMVHKSLWAAANKLGEIQRLRP